jgi:hypothetical protein
MGRYFKLEELVEANIKARGSGDMLPLEISLIAARKCHFPHFPAQNFNTFPEHILKIFSPL